MVGLALVSFIFGYVSPLVAAPIDQTQQQDQPADSLVSVNFGDRQDPRTILAVITDVEGATPLPMIYVGEDFEARGVVTTCAGAEYLLATTVNNCQPGMALADSPSNRPVVLSPIGDGLHEDPAQQTKTFQPARAPSSVVNALASDLAGLRPEPGQGIIGVVSASEIGSWPLAGIEVDTTTPAATKTMVRELATVAPGTSVGTQAQLMGTATSNASLRFALALLALIAGLMAAASLLLVAAEGLAASAAKAVAMRAVGAGRGVRRREHAWRLGVPVTLAAPIAFTLGAGLSLAATGLLGGEAAMPWPAFGLMLAVDLALCLLAVAVGDVVAQRQDPQTLRVTAASAHRNSTT